MQIFISVFCLIAAISMANGAFEEIGVAGGFTFYCDRNVKLSWSDAREYCRDHGKWLASTDTEAKSDLVLSWVTSELGRGGGVYTSGTDEGNEHNWYWDTSGKYFTYEAWSSNYGSDPPPIDTDSNCMVIYKPISSGGGYWIHASCDTVGNFVCQG